MGGCRLACGDIIRRSDEILLNPATGASVDLTSPTCQGNSPLLASSPPTILLRPTLPHMQWGGGMGDTGPAFTNLLKIDKITNYF